MNVTQNRRQMRPRLVQQLLRLKSAPNPIEYRRICRSLASPLADLSYIPNTGPKLGEIRMSIDRSIDRWTEIAVDLDAVYAI